MTAPVPFDGVFKMSGVWASAGSEAAKSTCWVTLREVGEGIHLSVPDYRIAMMTVREARSLAAQIMEAARRHEIRRGLQSK